MSTKPTNIDAYIATFPDATQQAMKQLRELIHTLVPTVEETISYAMPTFNLNGSYVVYFAGFKNHIGLYPAPVDNKDFEKDLAGYKTGRGSVQLPMGEPLPVKLITKIVKFQVKQNKDRAKAKK